MDRYYRDFLNKINYTNNLIVDPPKAQHFIKFKYKVKGSNNKRIVDQIF